MVVVHTGRLRRGLWRRGVFARHHLGASAVVIVAVDVVVGGVLRAFARTVECRRCRAAPVAALVPLRPLQRPLQLLPLLLLLLMMMMMMMMMMLLLLLQSLLGLRQIEKSGDNGAVTIRLIGPSIAAAQHRAAPR